MDDEFPVYAKDSGGKPLRLFRVQSDGVDWYVGAASYSAAIQKWRKIREEDMMSDAEELGDPLPQGRGFCEMNPDSVAVVCDESEFVL